MNPPIDYFSDPENVARYAEFPLNLVPGYVGMQKMTTLLIAERVSSEARLLILGAGGGLEMKVFAEAHPGWTFDGVDPSAEMLKLAERTMGTLAPRARLHQGFIEDAPDEQFDAATCLLTLHFVSPEERLRTVAEIHRRLKPGAPLVVAHLSIPGGEDERAVWRSRYAAFAIASGVDSNHATSASVEIDTRLHILTPEQDEAIFREAGFSNITLFYVGLTFRGWVAYA